MGVAIRGVASLEEGKGGGGGGGGGGGEGRGGGGGGRGGGGEGGREGRRGGGEEGGRREKSRLRILEMDQKWCGHARRRERKKGERERQR